MFGREHLVFGVPALAILCAAGPCSEDNPVTGSCPTSFTLRVERGSTSAPLPNICENGQDVGYWDRSKWQVVFDVPPPLRAVATMQGDDPNLSVYSFEAPADMAVGMQTVDLSVQIVGSRCTGADGVVADCRVPIAVTVEVVEPGTQTFAVRIERTLGGAPVPDNGDVPLGSSVELKASAEYATGAVTYRWSALRVLGGTADSAVDGKTDERVSTSPMPGARFVYAVHAQDEAGNEDDAQVTLVGQGPWQFYGRPETAVNQYPASPLQIVFPVPISIVSVEFRLEVADGSEAWARDAQDAFLVDELAQARAAWSTLEVLDTDRDDPRHEEPIQGSESTPLVYDAPAALSSRRGVLRLRAAGSAAIGNSQRADVEISYTFVRRH